MGSTSFLGFSCPYLLFVFFALVIFRNLLHIFARVLGLFLFCLFVFLYLILGC